MKTIVFALGVLCLSLNAYASDYIEERELTLKAEGIQMLDIACDAGSLTVRGEQRGDILTKAEIIVKGMSEEKAREFIQKKMTLTLKKQGSKGYLVSKVKNGFWGSWNAKINLSVIIPNHFDLDIVDGSGSIEARLIDGHISVKDGSGSIEIRSVNGDLVIVDGSGGIKVRRIGGSVTIKDGSGSISAEEISGNLSIVDGSGSMDVTRIGGSVVVNDGSGSIDINDVEKDVTIENAGSGSCIIAGVKGRVFKR